MIGDESNVKGEHRTMKMILHCLQVAMLAVMFVASPALPSNDPHGGPFGTPRPNAPNCDCQPPPS
jgi:hypothetical protein